SSPAINKYPAVKCKRRCVKVLRAIFPHLFLVSLLVTYAVVGAFIFQQLESGIKETEDYDQFLNRLWNITLTSESSKGKEGERVKMEMENFQSHWLIRKSNWTFLGSLFFSCTVFTTVGKSTFQSLLRAKRRCHWCQQSQKTICRRVFGWFLTAE
uniref:Potassium channel domain-containing protein n=1 Tax=Callorhinchus milii TaxID=7868 RepID=A0A4W3JNC0_CALMI